MFDLNLLFCGCFVLLTALLLSIFKGEKAWCVLLFSSLLFFAFLVQENVLLVIAMATATYFFGLLIEKNKKATPWLVALVLLPLLLKKTIWQEYQLNIFLTKEENTTDWLGFLGLSFLTFNAISYLIDVKRKYLNPERDFWKLLLYLVYLPMVISGPLMRAKYFFGQLEEVGLKERSVVKGLRLILWGLFKSMVIANRLFFILYTLIKLEITGPAYFFVGLVFFLFIYCSFSSFIHLFQGVSLLFNIQLPDNFRYRIYASSSRESYWQGWHMTLNQWFKDYFFYVIVRYDRQRKLTTFLLFVTFVLIALWHDLTWVFLCWGMLNATWLIAERKWKARNRGPLIPGKLIGQIYHVVLASLIATVFIAKDLNSLWNSFFTWEELKLPLSTLWVPSTFITFVLFVFMDWVERKSELHGYNSFVESLPKTKRYVFYYVLLFIILIFAVHSPIVNYYNAF